MYKNFFYSTLGTNLVVGLCFVDLFGVREAFSVVGDLPNFIPNEGGSPYCGLFFM